MSGLLGAAFLTFNALFQHANVRTPKWLGYLIQRPESHALHHGRGVHAQNYCDLPLWDIVFGTFCNPAEFRDEVGFEPGASARLWDMMCGRDVSLSEAANHHRHPLEGGSLPARSQSFPAKWKGSSVGAGSFSRPRVEHAGHVA